MNMQSKLLKTIYNYLHDYDYYKDDLEYFYYELKEEILDSKLPQTQYELFVYNSLINLRDTIRFYLKKF